MLCRPYSRNGLKDEKDQWAEIHHYDGGGHSKIEYWFSSLGDSVPNLCQPAKTT